jgi:hypothetical protein
LGAKNYLLIDGDRLEETNLNRVVFAKPSQVGIRKVEAARLYIKSIVDDATVQTIPGMVQSTRETEGALAQYDVVFGCVDDDGPRLLLNRAAISACVPYFDLATGILLEGSQPVVGGRVAITLPDGPCLTCTEELDVEEVRSYFMTDVERREAVRRGYIEGSQEAAPAVVSLNGLIAHAAITELALFLSGLRPPTPRLDLDVVGDTDFAGPRLLPRKGVNRNQGCVECARRQFKGAA